MANLYGSSLGHLELYDAFYDAAKRTKDRIPRAQIAEGTRVFRSISKMHNGVVNSEADGRTINPDTHSGSAKGSHRMTGPQLDESFHWQPGSTGLYVSLGLTTLESEMRHYSTSPPDLAPHGKELKDGRRVYARSNPKSLTQIFDSGRPEDDKIVFEYETVNPIEVANYDLGLKESDGILIPYDATRWSRKLLPMPHLRV